MPLIVHIHALVTAAVITALHLKSTLTEIGLLNEDDNGRTDLGTLEKRLAEKDAHCNIPYTKALGSDHLPKPRYK